MLTTNYSHKALPDALIALFASQARLAVLRVFMLDPTRPYYQRQIETATDLPIRAVQRELERLSSIELLYRRPEGNRTYYQVDTQFPLFPELRSMILKTATAGHRARGMLAMDESVRQAFLDEHHSRVLIVTGDGDACTPPDLPFSFDVMTSQQFSDAVAARSVALTPFLEKGADLLGRRDDVIWRRIDAAGYNVAKLEGVP
jgi:hypothetical protein